MNFKDKMNELAETSASGVKLTFSKYAIEKYGCNQLELKEFYDKYDQAVIYYQDISDRNESIGNTIKTISNLIFYGNIALGLINRDYLAEGMFLGLAGTTFVTSSIGGFIEFFGAAIPGVEYNARKSNPYIGRNTTFHKMAKDYAKYKRLTTEKL